MMSHTPRIFALLACLGLAVGCSDSSLTFSGQYTDVRPEAGQTGTPGDSGGSPGGRVAEGGLALEVSQPVSGEISIKKGVKVIGSSQGLTSVSINGTAVEIEGDTFEHTVIFDEGPQVITLSANGLSPLTIPIQVDLSPPVIELTSPQRGSFQIQGTQDEITVQGRATDTVTGVTSVNVNGQAVQLGPDGTFTTRLRPDIGSNIVLVEAVDGSGQSTDTRRGLIYGQFADYSALSDNAIGLRLGGEGIGVMEGIFGSVLGGLDLTSLAGDSGAGSDFEIQEITYQSVDVGLTPQNGYFDIEAAINDMQIGFETEQRIGFIPITVDGTISIDPAILRGKLYIAPDGQGGVSISFQDTSVELRNFDLDLDGILGIIDGLIEGFVEDLAKDLLSEALNGFALGETGGVNTPFDLLGQQAILELFISTLNVDPQGMTFGADAALNIVGAVDVNPNPGAFVTPSLPPSVEDPNKMLRFSLADDFVNQLLGNLWRTGLLNIDIGAALADGDALPLELNAGTFSLLVGQELLQYGDRDTPIGLKMRPLLPPLGKIQDPAQGIMKVTMSELLLDFTIDVPGQAPILWATVSSYLIMDVEIGFDEEGELDLQLTAEVYVELIDEPLFDIDDALLETTIAGLLQGLPAQLTEGDGIAGLLGGAGGGFDDTGYVIRNAEVRADGPSGDFMSFYLDLVPEF